MSDDLRSKIIRLAHARPELRPKLLPLLKQERTAKLKIQTEPVKVKAAMRADREAVRGVTVCVLPDRRTVICRSEDYSRPMIDGPWLDVSRFHPKGFYLLGYGYDTEYYEKMGWDLADRQKLVAVAEQFLREAKSVRRASRMARSWTPDSRVVSALNHLDQAVTHLGYLAREAPQAGQSIGKALKAAEAAQQVVERDVARSLNLPSRFASSKAAGRLYGITSIKGKTIQGSNVRIKIGEGSRHEMIITIQELNVSKPIKRKLGRVEYNGHRFDPSGNWQPSFRGQGGGYTTNLAVSWLFGAENLAKLAGFSSSMSFDQAVKALQGALKKAVAYYAKYMTDVFRKAPQFKYNRRELVPADESDLREAIKWAEDNVKWAFEEGEISWLKVEPADYAPIKFQGRDFSGTSQWGEFRFQADEQDEYMQYNEGMTAFYQAKSEGGARKLFKLLKAKPEMTRSMSLDEFKKMLDKTKIAYDYVPTVWR